MENVKENVLHIKKIKIKSKNAKYISLPNISNVQKTLSGELSLNRQ